MLHASPFLLWQIFHNKGRKWGWKAKTGPRVEREGITAIHVALDSQSPEVTVVRKLAFPTVESGLIIGPITLCLLLARTPQE